MPHDHHRWNFFRAGGFDQVRLESGADILHLDQLDQKLWVALACPTRGLEFDPKTLDLIDTDHDGRIRSPEILAAAKWTATLLKNPGDLLQSAAALPLAAINDQIPEGRMLLASAKQILINLGKGDATAITPEDTADTVKIFANTQFNGDGIISPDTSPDPALQSIITDIITCTGSITDRSGKPGIDQQKLDLFFDDAQAYADWYNKPKGDPAMPLGPNTAAAAAALKAVTPKIEDYFTRCRLVSFDPRALAALNRVDSDYLALAAKDLSATGSGSAEIAAFPIAKIAPNQPLTLDLNLINPAWRAAVAALVSQVIKPLLGDKPSLTESDWAGLIVKFAPVDAWLAAQAGAAVQKLGPERISAILAAGNGKAREQITALIAKDKALEPEATSIADVDKLVRYHRDLYKLLNNFVSFRDFYARKDKAIFQAGTLYLDQRACDLCVRVEDPIKHALMVHLSRTYLAYCDITRKNPDGSLQKMSIAAAYTAGDSDNLMVGRNGIFYDRLGRDWDATITKIVDSPISIRQAFFSPYKKVMRLISDQLAKRAAAADAAATDKLNTAAANATVGAATGMPPPPPPPPPKPKIDVGVVAALGVALGALSTAFGYFMGWLGSIKLYYLPLYIVVILLLISLPSMIIAWFKLRQRNLGPILDANGWAVNAKAKLNVPFGRSLTHTPKFPPGSKRNLTDPYAEKHTTRNLIIIVLLLLALAFSAWYFGCCQKYLPGYLPKSSFPARYEADYLIRLTEVRLNKKHFKQADDCLARLEYHEKELIAANLGEDYAQKIKDLKTEVETAEAAARPAATLPLSPR